MLRKLSLIRIISAIVVFVTSGVALGQTCEGLFREHQDWAARRKTVEAFLREHRDVPSFIKETENGPVPVLLFNEVTYPALAPLIENSVGYGYDITPNWVENGVVRGIGTEHAIMRSQGTLIDIGHPGTRRGPPNTEINKNGLAWKEIRSLLPWRRVMIQNSYLMPQADLDTVRFYHLARRASLFRTRYAFSEDHQLDRKTPNFCEGIPENCFRFSKSDQAPHMVEELTRQLRDLVGAKADQLLQGRETDRFADRARTLLLQADPYDPAQLNWSTLQTILSRSALVRKMPKNLTGAQRLTVANLLVSIRAINSYISVLRHYKISDHHGHQDVDAGVVSFTLIYDGMQAAEDFRTGRYEAHGTFFNWTNDNQHPLH